MKFAYKVIKTKNKKVEKVETPVINPTIGTSTGTVSFILVAKNTLGFRECAAIINIAKETNCKIKIASGKKSGTSESILSLVELAITADKSLVLTIKGKRNDEAFREISKIIGGDVANS
ncbi:MAG: HPr family phosphocarrier protein [Selenomonadaceae bacterium]|nr:HPr family phosphocarrier protein [Selenomonadaceae bacterium]